MTQPEDDGLAHGCAGLLCKVDLAYQPDGRLAVDAYADEACDIPDRATPVWRMEESSRHRSTDATTGNFGGVLLSQSGV